MLGRTFILSGTFILISGTSILAQEADMEFAKLHEAYLAKFKPLVIQAEQAWWDASISGTDEAFQLRKQADKAMVMLHSDRRTFAQLKAFKESNTITEPVLRRQLQVMYNNFLPNQVDPALSKKIVELEANVEQIFNTHRSLIDGKPQTENDVRKILGETTDSKLAEKAWKGYMAVGSKVETKLKEATKLRNQVARQLGFKNYFAMRLVVQEIDETELVKIFDELDRLTRKPFEKLKKEIDAKMAGRFGITTTQLRPWHYGDLFFQEAPDLEAVSLDDVLKSKDPLTLSVDFYTSMGMPVDDILARSDLYEKEGKSPHAFCACIDRAQDIRILCNIKPNTYWMDTVMHELGHAVYDKYIGLEVPFVLHTACHSLTTEGVAMMLGAMTKSEEFLINVLKLSPEQTSAYVEAARRSLHVEKLIFARWAQVMTRFERGMYENPDQDLGKLWWDLKKRYQLLNPPKDVSRPDYAAKIHVISHPVYYHNYMLGDLFACQVHYYIARNIVGVDSVHQTSFYGSRKAGDYMKEKIFAPGNLHHWQELIKRATGEPLSAKYFAEQYVH